MGNCRFVSGGSECRYDLRWLVLTRQERHEQVEWCIAWWARCGLFRRLSDDRNGWRKWTESGPQLRTREATIGLSCWGRS